MGGTAHRAIAAEEHQPPLCLQSSPRAPDLVLFYLKDLQLEAERFHIFTFRDNSVTSLEIKWRKKAEVETKNKSCTNNYISSWGQKENGFVVVL